MYANYWTLLLYFSRYYTIRLKMVIFCIYLFFLIYHLCEKCYKPITAQYNIADCVSYIPRLTFLDLRNKLDLWTHSQNRTHLYVGNLLYTAFHSNLVSEGFRKPDVRQALWVGAGEEQKESLACAQSRPTAKRATVQLKCPILQEVSKIIRLGWTALCPHVHCLCAWALFSVSLVYAPPHCPGKLLPGLT